MNFPSAWLGPVSVVIACVLLATTVAGADDDFNPFARSYVSRMPPPAVAAAVAAPRVFGGADKVNDYYQLLEDGYDLLGYSSFESGNVPPDKVRDHAAALNAELVLVYTRGIDSLVNRPGYKPMGDGATDKDETLYEYFATYWIKLPTPLLGLHVQRESRDDNAGLEVLAVVRQSPAASAGLRRGDVLTQAGGVELHQPEQLTQAAQRLAGQPVELVWQRGGEEFRKTVTLNRN